MVPHVIHVFLLNTIRYILLKVQKKPHRGMLFGWTVVSLSLTPNLPIYIYIYCKGNKSTDMMLHVKKQVPFIYLPIQNYII